VVQNISADFEGQVGMEFLREVEYGGNDQEFLIRPLRPQQPSNPGSISSER